jgi:hypothetical protein
MAVVPNWIPPPAPNVPGFPLLPTILAHPSWASVSPKPIINLTRGEIEWETKPQHRDCSLCSSRSY